MGQQVNRSSKVKNLSESDYAKYPSTLIFFFNKNKKLGVFVNKGGENLYWVSYFY